MAHLLLDLNAHSGHGAEDGGWGGSGACFNEDLYPVTSHQILIC